MSSCHCLQIVDHIGQFDYCRPKAQAVTWSRQQAFRYESAKVRRLAPGLHLTAVLQVRVLRVGRQKASLRCRARPTQSASPVCKTRRRVSHFSQATLTLVAEALEALEASNAGQSTAQGGILCHMREAANSSNQ